MTKSQNAASKLVLLVFVLYGCVHEDGKQATEPIPIITPAAGVVDRVNNFPFFVMSYEGDYHFADYLKTGVVPSLVRYDRSVGHKAWACTCFSALGNPETPFFGRNFDWRDCIPLLLITRPEKGYASVSMVDLEYLGFDRGHLPDDPSTNQGLSRAPYMPFDGMNEKGVAVGMMAVPSARGPQDPARVTIGELEVIRLVLDYAASVEEAIALIRRYNVRFTDPPIHYMIADKSGASVIVEFIDGEMQVIGSDQPWQVCTNFIISGLDAPSDEGCWRYRKAHACLSETKGIMDWKSACRLTEDVSQDNTIWSAVYDLQNGTVTVAIARDYSRWYQYALTLF